MPLLQFCHLFAGAVVQHMGGEAVAALPCCVAAQHIGHALLRLLPNTHSAVGGGGKLPVPGLLALLLRCVVGEPPGNRRLRRVHLLYGQCLIIKERRTAQQEGLRRRVGVLLPELLHAAAAVGTDAPPPPLQLLLVQSEVPLELPLLLCPLRAGRHRHAVAFFQIPRQEYRDPLVGAVLRPVPQLLEVVIAVGGGFDHHHRAGVVGHRLHNAQQQILLVLRPEGIFGDMYIGQCVRPAHAAAARRLAPDRAAQARSFGLFLWLSGGVLKDQLLGVAVLPHGLHPPGQTVIKELVHLEQVAGGAAVMGHDQGLYIGPRHSVLKHQRLRHRGNALLPPFQYDNADGLAQSRLLPDHGIQVALGFVEPQRHKLLLLVADHQQAFAVFLWIPQIHADDPSLCDLYGGAGGSAPPLPLLLRRGGAKRRRGCRRVACSHAAAYFTQALMFSAPFPALPRYGCGVPPCQHQMPKDGAWEILMDATAA